MNRDCFNAFCVTLPGAEVSDPWGDSGGGGDDAWKVGGKIFALSGASNLGVSVKTRDIETAQMLIEAGVAEKAPYLHRSWVRLPWTVDANEMRSRIEESYRLIRGGLPKKVQASLA